MPRRFRLPIIATVITALLLSSLSLAAVAQQNDRGIDEDFYETWARTDAPVAQGLVDRTWMWGPVARTESFQEVYIDSPGGTREVQYFDKSRMEINDPNGNADDDWYVTNGLLAVEMIRGEIRVGDEETVPHEASERPVAGDHYGTTAPGYADLEQHMSGLFNRGNITIVDQADADGNVSQDAQLSQYDVQLAFYDDETQHNIADVFYDFMTAEGPIMVDGELVQGPIVEDPIFATGRPVTDPLWVEAPVAGVQQDVLVQAFERRVLTYTPSNPEGWQVEMGNIGQHYFEWRYGQPPEDGVPGDPFPVVPVNPTATASNAGDVSETADYWVVDIFLTEEDRTNGTPLNPQDAWDAGNLTEIVYERPDGSTMTREPEGADAASWAKPTVDSQYAAGDHTLYYEYQGEWYSLTATFDANGELIAVNGDPYVVL